MKFGHERDDEGKRGISLFREIPGDRSCFDAYIPENFCSCLIDRSTINETIGNKTLPSQGNILKEAVKAIKSWISKQSLENCLEMDSLSNNLQFSVLGINPFARYGVQKMTNKVSVEKAAGGRPQMDFLWHEAVVPFRLKNSLSMAETKIRIEYDAAQERYSMNFEPLVLKPPLNCPFKSIFKVCDCLNSNL